MSQSRHHPAAADLVLLSNLAGRRTRQSVQIEAEIRAAVIQARQHGATWQSIATALGRTHQGVMARYGPLPRGEEPTHDHGTAPGPGPSHP